MGDKYTFAAVLDYAPDGVNITFPDLPGCFSCADPGDTAGAIQNAKEALALHLFCMEQDGEEIPMPTKTASLAKNQRVAAIDVYMPSIRAAMLATA